jgi:hypothetical protein
VFGLIGVADLDKAYEARGYSHAAAVSAQRVANALASFMGALNMVYPLSGWSLEVVPHPSGIRYIARMDCCGKVSAVEVSAKDKCFDKRNMSSDELLKEVYKRFSSVIPDIPPYSMIRGRIDIESFSTYKVLL